MSLQWTFVAVFLYAEIFILSLFLIPWIRPPIWQKIFKSRILRALEAYSAVYFYALFGVLLLLFFDAIREVRKYSGEGKDYLSTDTVHNTAHVDTTLHMRLFRSQRNLYIAGFALFLAIVIRRMVSLISHEAHLMASAEAAMRQAHGASETAKRLLADSTAEGKAGDDAELKTLKDTLTKLKEELKSANLDRDAMRKQSEAVKREYDRLLVEKTHTGEDKSDKKHD